MKIIDLINPTSALQSSICRERERERESYSSGSFSDYLPQGKSALFPLLFFTFISSVSITCIYSKHFHIYLSHKTTKHLFAIGQNDFEYLARFSIRFIDIENILATLPILN